MIERLLLVEDDDQLRAGLELVLVDAGFEVVSRTNGRDALKILQQVVFDAIILDDNLPFIQGSDLLGLIRVHSPDVRIIVISGLFNADGMKKIKENGADLVMEKPFEYRQLLTALRKLLKS